MVRAIAFVFPVASARECFGDIPVAADDASELRS
jgi:hypothetical protein